MANLRVDKITSTETFETTGSVQFDGTTDFLSLSSSTDFAMGTGDFTAECWVYVVNHTHVEGGYGQRIFDSNTGQLGIYINSDGTGGYVGALVSGTDIRPTVAHGIAPEGTWTHAAICRSGDDFRIFVNGREAAYRSGTGSVASSADFRIGARASGEGGFKGHISNLRIIKGKALYTANFKPPMKELEVVPGTALLACQSKTDASLEKTGKTITVSGNAVASELTPGLLTPIVKSGGGSAITGSVEFDGTGDYLSIPDSTDFTFGTGDFTIEFWRYRSRVANTESYVTKYNNTNATQSFWFGTLSSGREDFAWYSGSNGYSIISANNVAQVGEWGHLAAVRYNGDITLYLNGVAIGSDTSSNAAASFNDDSNPLIIGGDNYSGSTYDYQGFISNLRVLKGTALYTADFIPPTRELKKVPGTVLLACQDPDDPFTEATGKTLGGGGNFQRSNGIEYITNGSFVGGYTTEWEAKNSANITHSNNTVSVTSTQNYSGIRVKSAYLPTLVAGRKYAMTVDIVSLTNPIRFGVISGNTLSDISTAGKHTLIFTGTASTTEIYIEKATGSNSTFVLDSVSIKEIDGSHPSSNFTPQVGDDRKVTFEGVTKINSNAYFYLPTGNTESREATGTYNAGTRGLFTGGYDSPALKDTIDYITISSTGNALDFGNLTDARLLPGALSSSVRGIIGGGTDPSASNIIDYVTIPSTGNALDFGDLTVARRALASFSNNVRGIWAGGDNPSRQTTIDYVTISSTGNAIAFGSLGEATNTLHGTSSPTRGLLMGGETGSVSPHNAISYVTISTTGSNKDFGDLTQARRGCSSCSSPIRALTGGGNTGSITNAIDFVTIATTGNASDFGDLTQARWLVAATSNSIRGVWGGGYNPSPAAEYDIIDFITIASTGNAIDFGNLQTSKRSVGACSNGHGGLG